MSSKLAEARAVLGVTRGAFPALPQRSPDARSHHFLISLRFDPRGSSRHLSVVSTAPRHALLTPAPLDKKKGSLHCLENIDSFNTQPSSVQ